MRKKTAAFLLIIMMVVLSVPHITANTTSEQSATQNEFVPVTSLGGIPASAVVRPPIPVHPFTVAPTPNSSSPHLFPFVLPHNSTNTNVSLSIVDAGETGVILHYYYVQTSPIVRNVHRIDGVYTLTAEKEGEITLRAVVQNGTADGIDFVQYFAIPLTVIERRSYGEQPPTSLPTALPTHIYANNDIFEFIPATSIVLLRDYFAIGENAFSFVTQPYNATIQTANIDIIDCGNSGISFTHPFTRAIFAFTAPSIFSDIAIGNPIIGLTVMFDDGIRRTIPHLFSIVDNQRTATPHLPTEGRLNVLRFSVAREGVITLRATLPNATAENKDLVQYFTISISANPVEFISGVPTYVWSNYTNLPRFAFPATACNRNIAWSIIDPGTTGATIRGNTLTTPYSGVVNVRATVVNGIRYGENYVEDFAITVNETSIAGIPHFAYIGELVLSPIITPHNIHFITLTSSGTTEATINRNILTTSATGTITVRISSSEIVRDFDIIIVDPAYANIEDLLAYYFPYVPNYNKISNAEISEIRLPYSPLPTQNTNAIVVYRICEDAGQVLIPQARYVGDYMVFNYANGKFIVAYNPVTFNDITNHWAQDVIEQAAARRLLHGRSEDYFIPDERTTRAEFVQMIQNVLTLETHTESLFADVTTGWYLPAVSALEYAGLLDGLTVNGMFLPNQPIQRQEMAVILANIAELYELDNVNKFAIAEFSDVTEAHHSTAIETAVRVGLLSPAGMSDGSFSPEGFATRAQAAMIQMRLLEALN